MKEVRRGRKEWKEEAKGTSNGGNKWRPENGHIKIRKERGEERKGKVGRKEGRRRKKERER